MAPNSVIQHRAKQINISFTRELSLIQREHSQNLNGHRKLENSIRRFSDQLSDPSQLKISIPFKQIYNEQTGTLDPYQRRDSKYRSSLGAIGIINNVDPNQTNSDRTNEQTGALDHHQRRDSKVRSSLGAIGIINSMYPNQTNFDRTDEYSDDSSPYIPFRRRRFCTKAQRLPPIIKANASHQQKHENKTQPWMASPPETDRTKEDNFKQFTPVTNEVPSLIPPPELTPIQRQVRSFLESLPSYKGVQDGFDSFAPASLYSIRAPILIR